MDFLVYGYVLFTVVAENSGWGAVDTCIVPKSRAGRGLWAAHHRRRVRP